MTSLATEVPSLGKEVPSLGTEVPSLGTNQQILLIWTSLKISQLVKGST